MARIRTIKPEFWADEKLAPLDPLTRLVFLGLISLADDAGRVLDSVRAIDGFIFSQTEDTCRESVETLVRLGRVTRGLTASGQRVLQITNWDKHQKIDRPNKLAALPPIVQPVLDEASTNARRKIDDASRALVWERDKATCQDCGRPVRRDKADRYDSGDDLGEIDHIIPVADGGTNDPQNLRLTCLSCNRRKAGADVRRRNDEASTKDRRKLDEASSVRSTIYDQRSTSSSASSKDAAALRLIPTDSPPDQPLYQPQPRQNRGRDREPGRGSKDFVEPAVEGAPVGWAVQLALVWTRAKGHPGPMQEFADLMAPLMAAAVERGYGLEGAKKAITDAVEYTRDEAQAKGRPELTRFLTPRSFAENASYWLDFGNKSIAAEINGTFVS